jgi:hypothetical protein
MSLPNRQCQGDYFNTGSFSPSDKNNLCPTSPTWGTWNGCLCITGGERFSIAMSKTGYYFILAKQPAL